MVNPAPLVGLFIAVRTNGHESLALREFLKELKQLIQNKEITTCRLKKARAATLEEDPK